jgi:hypothetical protein
MQKTFFERAQECSEKFLADPLLLWVGAGGAESIADTYIALYATSMSERYLMREYVLGAWLVSEVRVSGVTEYGDQSKSNHNTRELAREEVEA